ncbi:hypothetical protein GCM10009727_43360 [Actinomadura napierensis]|uniref:Uncharacterized protein n=1 Tax=Actinomadura napierensis TaxID=267854 RepID=A0ABN2ZL68_9ACTN
MARRGGASSQTSMISWSSVTTWSDLITMAVSTVSTFRALMELEPPSSITRSGPKTSYLKIPPLTRITPARRRRCRRGRSTKPPAGPSKPPVDDEVIRPRAGTRTAPLPGDRAKVAPQLPNIDKDPYWDIWGIMRVHRGRRIH